MRKLITSVLAAALVITLAALGLWATGGHESAVAQGTVNFDIDPETTGNSADTLGAIEDCVRVDIPSPAFDGVSDYNIDIVVTGDTQAPMAYDAALLYDENVVHVADPGTDQLVKLPGAISLTPDTDSDGVWNASALYLSGGAGIAGNGTIVRVGLDINDPTAAGAVVTFSLQPEPFTDYASCKNPPDCTEWLNHPTTADSATLAINQDCPPPGTPTPAPTPTPPPTATPTPTPTVTPTPGPAPANDDFDNAAVIPELPFVDYMDTRGATTAADDPDCFGRDHTVWYTFTTPENLRIEANTFGSNYDTTLSVYTGSRGALSQIACNDDADSLQSFVTFDAVPGEAYFFMIGAYGSRPGGDLTFSVDVVPPPLEIDVSIDPLGAVVAKTGAVTIGGIVTCSKAAFVDLYGELEQRAGRVIVRGYFSSSVLCAGQAPWSATVVGDNGVFKAGAADVSVSAYAFTDDEFAFAEATAPVQLKGSRPPKLCPHGGNEGFEAGVVNANVIPCWTTVDQAGGSAGWCNQGGTLPPQGACAGSLTSVAVPPEGAQAAMTNQDGPGSHTLYRCGVLRSGPISFELYINNEFGAFFNPSSLDFGGFPNQQFRADLVTAAGIAADPFTTSPEDVLLNIYQTMPGDPPVSGYATITADASAWVGQAVCLRLAAVENLWFFHAGVDDVNIDLRSRG